MSNDETRNAVRGLRRAMNMSQTQFGSLIGKSLPTIQRYETLVPPRGKILLKLEALARSRHFDEYAQTFREAIREELGLEIASEVPSEEPLRLDLMKSNPVESGVGWLLFDTSNHRSLFRALRVLSERSDKRGRVGASARKQLDAVTRAMRPTLLALEKLDGPNNTIADQAAAVARLSRDGFSRDEIARKLDIAKEQVDKFFN